MAWGACANAGPGLPGFGALVATTMTTLVPSGHSRSETDSTT